MKYFGIEIFDGKIYSDFPLEEDLPLEEQWFFLSQDVGNVEFHFRGMIFGLDISWFGHFEDIYNPEYGFRVDIAEWGRNEFKMIYRVFVRTDLRALKQVMQEAVDLIQSFREKSIEELDAMPDVRQ
ncbi:hypothetical protein [Chitinophaga filiformis]|uniref:Uncharacterized protein n=1 Tax=Chitinophaga filiformis TaxID=104663 RepID=A0A1G7Y2R9_CHIFI|nr:hypothetical protein [Chitinophaga filiformis]SDG90260.1 hypothetical protein SAMN04488121_107166 [Chitinophaga filiformis]